MYHCAHFIKHQLIYDHLVVLLVNWQYCKFSENQVKLAKTIHNQFYNIFFFQCVPDIFNFAFFLHLVLYLVHQFVFKTFFL